MYFFDLRDALKTPSSWDLPTKLRRVPIQNLSVWGKTVPRCSSCSGQQQGSTPVYGNEANREVTSSTTEFWHCFSPPVLNGFPCVSHNVAHFRYSPVGIGTSLGGFWLLMLTSQLPQAGSWRSQKEEGQPQRGCRVWREGNTQRLAIFSNHHEYSNMLSCWTIVEQG